MTEPERLERHLDDFGARLVRAAAAAPPPPRRRRSSLALALTTAVTAIVAVVVVLAASGERSLDPVAEARAALAPPGEIVYMRITSTTIAPGSSSVPPPRTTEQWSVAEPPSWRFVETIPRPTPSRGGMLDADGRPLFGRQERSYADGVERAYNAERDTIVVTRGYRDRDGAARLPSVLGQGSGDPESDLRSMLLKGTVTDRGEQQFRGRTVRRFVIEQRSHLANDPEIERRLVYDVDPATFAPVEGRLSLSFGARRNLPRVTLRMRVDVYRRIPLTAKTAGLLRITTTPRTKATFDTKQKLQARHRAWRAKCRDRGNGGLVCPPPYPAPKRPR